MRSNPLVSILINNYNYGFFLGDAIDSALAQDYEKVEVVVVDDGSTDNSRALIERYGGRIVSVMKKNGGQASAFNAGFAASNGDIICFLDSDDLFAREKVSCVLEIFKDNPRIGWCFDRVKEFDNKTGEHYPRPVKCRFGPWDAREMVVAGKAPYVPTATSGLSFRRDTLARILPMPERIRITSDNYVKIVALALAEGWMASQELSLQRIHDDNAYTNRFPGQKLLSGRTGLLTGLCLHEQFPALRRLAKKSFSYALGMCWRAGGFDSECRLLTRSFFRELEPSARAEILMRAAYWSVRHLLSRA